MATASTRLIKKINFDHQKEYMKLEERLNNRSGGKCELCGSGNLLTMYEVPPVTGKTEENTIEICNKCLEQVDKKEEAESKYWMGFLGTSMWSEIPAVQVVSWRMLNRFRDESWAADNLDMFYLDDEKLAWAKATGDHEMDSAVDLHKDANGHILRTGDTVVLVKSLDVKGSALHAKMGTVVKNIRLVDENTEQIEGRIEGQVIVILTKYVRKQQAGS
jgi:protein PhnA